MTQFKHSHGFPLLIDKKLSLFLKKLKLTLTNEAAAS